MTNPVFEPPAVRSYTAFRNKLPPPPPLISFPPGTLPAEIDTKQKACRDTVKQFSHLIAPAAFDTPGDNGYVTQGNVSLRLLHPCVALRHAMSQ